MRELKKSTGMPRHIISVDLGGTSFKAGIVTEAGRVLCRAQAPTPAERKPAHVLAVLEKLILELEKSAPADTAGDPLGISIGVPGVVDRANGDVINCFNVFGHDHQRVPLKKDMEARTGRTIQIEKDLNLAALGEHWMGAGRGTRDILCVFIGTGIGSGLILEDRLFRGALGAAGEIGHLTIEKDGPQCGCGNRGCLEQFASGPAILRMMKRKMADTGAGEGGKGDRSAGSEMTTSRIFELAQNGDGLALQVVDEACMYLGIGLANALTLLNPALLILGGGVGKRFDFILGRIWVEIRARCRPSIAGSLKIVPSALWNDAALLGGARAFFEGRQGGSS